MSSTLQGIRVLLIDDEAEFVNTLAERLELRGLVPQVAETGHDGLAMLEDSEFQVVLLDMMLPGMRGTDVLRKIRTSHQTLPVILLTGNANAKDGIAGMKEGASAYLTKPVDLNELLRVVQEMVQGEPRD
ncbi:response regulator [Desulfovibrio cuneatus]|uniref:response regulator n=1 Tax=Desulfovibrio cuneatus TaxID=159728 RepID=UPI0004253C00|nr:response regulator [Desulfovibrio cuneatus]